MDLIQKELLEEIAGLHEVPAGAYNIRANEAATKEKPQLLILILFLKKISRELILSSNREQKKVYIPVVISPNGLK